MSDPAFVNFLEVTRKRQEDARNHLRNLRETLVRQKPEALAACGKRAITALGRLGEMFHEGTMPHWINPLVQDIGRVLEAKDADQLGNHAAALLEHLFSFNDAIYNHNLADRDVQPSLGIDFEATYTNEFRASHIPQLFDRLIGMLESVIQSGHIDSSKALKALQDLIGLLKKNKASSYSSAQWAWVVFCAGARNILYRFTESVPVLGPIVQGIDDTIKEVDVEWSHVREQAAAKIKTTFPFDIPGIEKAQPPREIAGDVVDAEFEVPKLAGPKAGG